MANRFDRRRAGNAPPSEVADGDDGDVRSRAQKDRDRLLYCSAFRRLAGITQVADPSEGHFFHNRLTHTLKVAQIGRRIAEKLLREQSDEAAQLGGIDPDVVEAAALAHDLGHPPFGHTAEATLDHLLTSECGCANGFEGNAQSFRIVTRLASHKPMWAGLDLTRATLNATLKYPWTRANEGHRRKKFGAYDSEREFLEWAREGWGLTRPKCPEAEIMDWADDITYAVHDMEDFYRAGLIPLDKLRASKDERARFLLLAQQRWASEQINNNYQPDYLSPILEDLFGLIPVSAPFDTSHHRRAHLHLASSALITNLTNSIRLVVPADPENARCVQIGDEERAQATLLKELTWIYAIQNPALSTQAYGKERIIRELFRIYWEKLEKENPMLLPEEPRRQAEEILRSGSRDERAPRLGRLIADLICSLTERDAVRLHQRLTGMSLGSIYDSLPA